MRIVQSLLHLLLGTVYIISVIGKAIDLESFQNQIRLFGFPEQIVAPPEQIAILILIFEFLIGVMLLLFIKTKIASVASIILLCISTFIFILGYSQGILNSCGCFGSLIFLNSNSLVTFLTKNTFIALLSFFAFKLSHIKQKMPAKGIVIAMSVALIISGFLYNDYYLENVVKKNLGLPITSLPIPIAKDYEFVFLYLPTCPHCQQIIPEINSLSKGKTNKVLGVTMNQNLIEDSEWDAIHQNLEITFPTITIESKSFKKITRQVPILLKIEKGIVTEIVELDKIE